MIQKYIFGEKNVWFLFHFSMEENFSMLCVTRRTSKWLIFNKGFRNELTKFNYL